MNICVSFPREGEAVKEGLFIQERGRGNEAGKGELRLTGDNSTTITVRAHVKHTDHCARELTKHTDHCAREHTKHTDHAARHGRQETWCESLVRAPVPPAHIACCVQRHTRVNSRSSTQGYWGVMLKVVTNIYSHIDDSLFHSLFFTESLQRILAC